ncbi:MAG TPA: hypothetical protein VK540_17925 [Polyangiaceae bacterium]|jgi:hypothetical protein|nr:hypothetical protein [Polyangiaceae bacterium]
MSTARFALACRSNTLRRILGALPLVFALDLYPMTAAATEPLSPSAERLFTEGLKLAHGGDCVRARDKFTESYAADAAPGTLINWALCEEKLGRSATALELLRLADQGLPANHPKRPAMMKRIEALTKRAPLLRLRLTSPLPPGATVTMDGAILEPSAFARGVLGDPGTRLIEMRAPGREDRRYEVTLAEGTTFEVTIEPGPPRAGGAKTGGGAPGAPGADAPSATPWTTIGWSLAGGGLAVVGAGVVTGLLAMNKKDEVERANCNVETNACENDDGVRASAAGRTLAAVSTTTFILGGASLAVGGYLLLTKKDAPITARVATTTGPSVIGLRLSGEF